MPRKRRANASCRQRLPAGSGRVPNVPGPTSVAVLANQSWGRPSMREIYVVSSMHLSLYIYIHICMYVHMYNLCLYIYMYILLPVLIVLYRMIQTLIILSMVSIQYSGIQIQQHLHRSYMCQVVSSGGLAISLCLRPFIHLCIQAKTQPRHESSIVSCVFPSCTCSF